MREEEVVITNISHPFHCFYCGTQLIEIGLGILECPNCLKDYIPFIDNEGNQCLSYQTNKTQK